MSFWMPSCFCGSLLCLCLWFCINICIQDLQHLLLLALFNCYVTVYVLEHKNTEPNCSRMNVSFFKLFSLPNQSSCNCHIITCNLQSQTLQWHAPSKEQPLAPMAYMIGLKPTLNHHFYHEKQNKQPVLLEIKEAAPRPGSCLLAF